MKKISMACNFNFVVKQLFTDFERSALSVHSDVMAIVRAMSLPDSGLEIRDRMWLKITIPNAFIGMIHLSLNLAMTVQKD
jgi:hypothetical protein